MKWNEIQKIFSDTVREDWTHKRCGAWIHKDAKIGKKVKIDGPCVIRNGTFCGGTFHGGWFYGGYFDGGAFYSGSFHDGYFDSGVFYSGTFHDGYFDGGSFRGGIYTRTPTQIFGLIEFDINVSGPDTIKIGCMNKTVDWWKEHWKAVAEKENVSIEKAKKIVEMIDDFVYPIGEEIE